MNNQILLAVIFLPAIISLLLVERFPERFKRWNPYAGLVLLLMATPFLIVLVSSLINK